VHCHEGSIVGQGNGERAAGADAGPEDSLRASERKYRTLIEATGTGYVILDAEGKVLDANPEYVRLAGRSSLQEILGAKVTEWTAPYDLIRNLEEVRKCLERGSVRNLEIDFTAPGGAITPVEINATVLDGPTGPRILTLCTDITGRRKLEQSLREMENLFTLLLEHSPVYIFFKDADLRPIYLSRNFEQMLGRPLDQILGRTMDELFPPEQARIVQLLVEPRARERQASLRLRSEIERVEESPRPRPSRARARTSHGGRAPAPPRSGGERARARRRRPRRRPSSTPPMPRAAPTRRRSSAGSA